MGAGGAGKERDKRMKTLSMPESAMPKNRATQAAASHTGEHNLAHQSMALMLLMLRGAC